VSTVTVVRARNYRGECFDFLLAAEEKKDENVETRGSGTKVALGSVGLLECEMSSGTMHVCQLKRSSVQNVEN